MTNRYVFVLKACAEGDDSLHFVRVDFDEDPSETAVARALTAAKGLVLELLDFDPTPDDDQDRVDCDVWLVATIRGSQATVVFDESEPCPGFTTGSYSLGAYSRNDEWQPAARALGEAYGR